MKKSEHIFLEYDANFDYIICCCTRVLSAMITSEAFRKQVISDGRSVNCNVKIGYEIKVLNTEVNFNGNRVI